MWLYIDFSLKDNKFVKLSLEVNVTCLHFLWGVMVGKEGKHIRVDAFETAWLQLSTDIMSYIIFLNN
jgi:hypothetical protein